MTAKMKRHVLLTVLAMVAWLGCGPGGDPAGEQLALLIRSYFREPFRIPSESMVPTLLAGDQIFVDKAAYRARDPIRGEVVVFWVARDGSTIRPADTNPDIPREAFVFRVVGLPGDQVELKDGILVLNGTPVVTEPSEESHLLRDGTPLQLYSQVLEERTIRIAYSPDVPEIPVSPILVETDRYLVLGDHRNRANDGRFWGTVHRSDLIGPVTSIYFSKVPGSAEIRWSRIGSSVH